MSLILLQRCVHSLPVQLQHNYSVALAAFKLNLFYDTVRLASAPTIWQGRLDHGHVAPVQLRRKQRKLLQVRWDRIYSTPCTRQYLYDPPCILITTKAQTRATHCRVKKRADSVGHLHRVRLSAACQKSPAPFGQSACQAPNYSIARCSPG